MAASHYPVSLLLTGRKALVVGGGPVAARKARGLAVAGAAVTVVAPALGPAMERLVERGVVRLRRRTFRRGDAAGAAVVVAATDDHQVNLAVRESGRAAGALVNVVDQPDLCDFIAPAVVRRGPLTLAISTGGASPALAARLRGELQAYVGPEWATITTALSAFRRRLSRRFADRPAVRRRLLVAASRLDLVGAARSGGRRAVDRELRELLGSEHAGTSGVRRRGRGEAGGQGGGESGD